MSQHILYNHIPWFANQYGCPAIWSTQGMEKTHYQARGAYFRHTQHGGGTIRANSFKEVFFWFYRRIILRTRKQEFMKQKKDARSVAICKKIKERRQRWKDSTAEQNSTLWRATRVRQNKIWVPREEHVIT